MPSAKSTRAKAATTKKRGAPAANTSKMLEEAPLLAGLDDFVFISAAKPAPPTVLPEKKKKPAAQKKQAQKKSGTQTAKAAAVKPTPSARSAAKKKATPSGVPRRTAPPVIGPDDILLSIRELCGLLKISRATLVRMDNAGKLPGRIMIGGSVRFHRKTIDAWIEEKLAGATH